jgi:hypothetical protein
MKNPNIDLEFLTDYFLRRNHNSAQNLARTLALVCLHGLEYVPDRDVLEHQHRRGRTWAVTTLLMRNPQIRLDDIERMTGADVEWLRENEAVLQTNIVNADALRHLRHLIAPQRNRITPGHHALAILDAIKTLETFKPATRFYIAKSYAPELFSKAAINDPKGYSNRMYSMIAKLRPDLVPDDTDDWDVEMYYSPGWWIFEASDIPLITVGQARQWLNLDFEGNEQDLLEGDVWKSISQIHPTYSLS